MSIRGNLGQQSAFVGTVTINVINAADAKIASPQDSLKTATSASVNGRFASREFYIAGGINKSPLLPIYG